MTDKYFVWTVFEDGQVARYYVINIRFKNRVHSIWKDLITARKTAQDLNSVAKAQNAYNKASS